VAWDLLAGHLAVGLIDKAVDIVSEVEFIDAGYSGLHSGSIRSMVTPRSFLQLLEAGKCGLRMGSGRQRGDDSSYGPFGGL